MKRLTKSQKRYGYARTIRRERVARLRLRHLSLDEIARALSEGDQMLANPATGRAWGRMTFYRDLVALDQEARANAARDTEKHRAELLAENVEGRRAAWTKTDVRAVFTGIAQAARLTGAFRAEKLAQFQIDYGKLTNEQLERLAAGEDVFRVITSTGRGGTGAAAAGGDLDAEGAEA